MFDDAGRAAYINAMVASAMIEMEGMKAMNTELALVGDPPRYKYQNFQDVILSYGIHHNAVVEFLRAGR
jgi:hypothetical protein